MPSGYQDHYAVLGVSRDATPEEIKRAYRRLMRQLHPDANPDANAEAQAKAVNWAYDVLSDPTKRAAFDESPAPGDSTDPPPVIFCWPNSVDFGDVEIEGHYRTAQVRIYFDPKHLSADDVIDFEPEYGTFWRIDSLREPDEGEEKYDTILYDVKLSTELQPDISTGLQSESLYFLVNKVVVCELPIRATVVGLPSVSMSTADDETTDDWPYPGRATPITKRRTVRVAAGAFALLLIGTLVYFFLPGLRQHSQPQAFPYISIQKHNQDVIAIAVSSKRAIASASIDGTVIVSEPNGGNEQTVISDGAGSANVRPTSLSFSADGMYLAVGYTNGEVVVFNFDRTSSKDAFDPGIITRKNSTTLAGAVADVAFSPVNGDETLAVVTSDKEYRGNVDMLTISPQGGLATKDTLPTNAAGVSLAYSPDARFIAVVVKSLGKPSIKADAVQLWDVSAHRLAASISDNAALSASFSPDNHILAIADDTTVSFWDMQRSKIARTLHHLALGTVANVMSGPHMIAYSSIGTNVVAFVTSMKDSMGNIVEFYDVAADKPLAYLSSDAYVYALAFDPHGGLFSTGGGAANASPGYGDNAVRVWDLVKIDD